MRIDLTVEAYGHKGNPYEESGTRNDKKVKFGRHDAADFRAKWRFKNLKANSIRVTGSGIGGNRDPRNYHMTHRGYTFAVIEVEPISDDAVAVYFVCWADSDSKSPPQKPDVTRDLTVTIDTVDAPDTEGSGSDEDVEYEESPADDEGDSKG